MTVSSGARLLASSDPWTAAVRARLTRASRQPPARPTAPGWQLPRPAAVADRWGCRQRPITPVGVNEARSTRQSLPCLGSLSTWPPPTSAQVGGADAAVVRACHALSGFRHVVVVVVVVVAVVMLVSSLVRPDTAPGHRPWREMQALRSPLLATGAVAHAVPTRHVQTRRGVARSAAACGGARWPGLPPPYSL